MHASDWILRVAILVVVVSSLFLAWGWGVCLFGTSDDGMHCVPAVFATATAGPLAAIAGVAAWLARRGTDARRR